MRSFRFEMIGVAVVAALGSMVVPGAVLAQNDASIGTWRLSIPKSTLSGPAPRNETVTIEAVEDGVRFTAKGTDTDGRPFSRTYTATLNGKDAPVTFTGAGSTMQDYDTVSVKRLDARKTEGVLKKNGQVVMTYSRVVSRDGDTMTITTTGTPGPGGRTINVAVYDKESERRRR
jgi:hypothetical protein